MKLAVPALITVTATLIWGAQRLTTADLNTEVSLLRAQSRELDDLRYEQDRLRQRQLDAAELADAQRDAGEHSRLQRELAEQEASRAQTDEKAFNSSWKSAADWKNCGNADPTATVETTLWAAAGGDVATLQNLLQLENSARARARELFEQLPAGSRGLYSSPEHFVAALTVKAIPLGGAQLMRQQQTDLDQASVWVFLRDHRSPDTVNTPPAPNAPPMQSETIPTNSAYLNLRRNADGWKLVVPRSAVEKLAREQMGVH